MIKCELPLAVAWPWHQLTEVPLARSITRPKWVLQWIEEEGEARSVTRYKLSVLTFQSLSKMNEKSNHAYLIISKKEDRHRSSLWLLPTEKEQMRMKKKEKPTNGY